MLFKKIKGETIAQKAQKLGVTERYLEWAIAFLAGKLIEKGFAINKGTDYNIMCNYTVKAVQDRGAHATEMLNGPDPVGQKQAQTLFQPVTVEEMQTLNKQVFYMLTQINNPLKLHASCFALALENYNSAIARCHPRTFAETVLKHCKAEINYSMKKAS